MKKITEEQKRILLKKHTEAPGTGIYLHHKADGTYTCAQCDQLLFNSEEKFDSGSGWPSFSDAVKENIELISDNSAGMKRIEVVCKKCKGHLGHVFDDGPTKTKKRYCINSLSLDFKMKK